MVVLQSDTHTVPLEQHPQWWDKWGRTTIYAVPRLRWPEANVDSLGSAGLRDDVIEALMAIDTDCGLLRPHFKAAGDDSKSVENDIVHERTEVVRRSMNTDTPWKCNDDPTDTKVTLQKDASVKSGLKKERLKRVGRIIIKKLRHWYGLEKHSHFMYE